MSEIAWISSVSAGKGRFGLILPDGTSMVGVLKRSLVAHWHRDPRRLTVGTAVLIDDSSVSPALIVKILAPAEAQQYGPPPVVQDQIVTV